MNLDKAIINIKAGCGGDGVVRFRREKYVANGGPNGGNGGCGGNVIFEASLDKNTLSDFQFVKSFSATDGSNGDGSYCNGKNGEDVIIKVPCGTIIRDHSSGKIIIDMYEPGQQYIVLHGGKGGKGNAFFKTSTRQAPHFSQLGEKCKYFKVVLELKVIADVALVGKPNVGKSTILSIISNAKPKIANYDFTTLSPNLGVSTYYDKSFCVADIPGLIEGASLGAGLGHEFLAHIERARLIVHVIDISGINGNDPIQDYFLINNELKNYKKDLSTLPQIIVLTKVDLINDLDEKIESFKKETKTTFEVIPVCAIINQNIDKMKQAIWQQLEKLPKLPPMLSEIENIDERDITSINIQKESENTFRLSGGLLEHLQRGIVFDDFASQGYFMGKLKEHGIFEMLKENGAIEGDTVLLGDLEFEITD